MYYKLINKNIKKIFRDYLVYFITLSVCSTLFFAFISLSSSNNDILGDTSQYSLKIFQDTIRYSVYLISVIFFILVNYTNSHMLKRRSREFFIYLTLGTEKHKLSAIFFIEMFSVGLSATILGCLAGTLLSGILTSIVTLSTGGIFDFRINFYFDSAIATIVFFSIIFCIVGLFNNRKLNKIKLVDLKDIDKELEGNKISKKTYLIHTIICLICYAITFILIKDFLSQGRHYNGIIPETISNRYQAICAISITLGTFSGYFSISYLILIIKEHWNKYTHSNLNFVFINNLYSRLSSNAKVVASATIVITISIVGFIIAPILASITEGFLEYRMPYDLMIYNQYRYIDEIDDIPKIDYTFVDDILEKYDINISDTIQQESYFLHKSDFKNNETRENKWDFPRLAVRLSDYNKMREMAGYSKINLKNNEFVMHLSQEIEKEEVLSKIDTREIKLDNEKLLILNSKMIYNEPLGNYMFNFGESSALILPDEACEELYLATTSYYLNTQNPIPYDKCEKIEDEISYKFKESYSYLYDKYETKYKDNKDYQDFIDPIRFYTKELNTVELGSLSIKLLGIYIGVVFFIICLTIFSLQQLTDSIESKNKYKILYKLGVDERDIYKLIKKQIKLFFAIPVILAMCGAALAIYVFWIRLGHKVNTYIGSMEFYLICIMTFTIIILLLILYYVGTFRSYKYNIKEIFEKNNRKIDL